MKKLIFAAMLTVSMSTMAQDIKLPAPNTDKKSTTVVEALKTRHSTREFATTELSNQELSDLCWAACGMSRDDNHRTAPTAMNRQEIRLFVFLKNGVYEYNAKSNTLIKKADGDNRSLIGGRQASINDAPVSLLMVIDYDIFRSTDEHAIYMTCIDAGIVSENINLYCQSVGLVTVPRASHDTDGIRKLLNLTDKQLPILNNPVGYPKK